MLFAALISANWSITCDYNEVGIGVGEGTVYIWKNTNVKTSSGLHIATSEKTIWLPQFIQMTNLWGIVIPIWIPIVAVALAYAIDSRYGRFAQVGLCENCFYDLRGNQSGVCPECGMRIEMSGTAQRP